MLIFNLQTFNTLNATLSAETAVMQSNVSEINNRIRKQETIWKDLQNEYNRIEILLEKANEEQQGLLKKGNEKRTTLKETLTQQIHDQEQLAEDLSKVKLKLLRKKLKKKLIFLFSKLKLVAVIREMVNNNSVCGLI